MSDFQLYIANKNYSSYCISLEGREQAYAQALVELPAMRDWVREAAIEKEVLEAYERKA